MYIYRRSDGNLVGNPALVLFDIHGPMWITAEVIGA
jgi:hypothetical protein